jgi:hypothetical protein
MAADDDSLGGLLTIVVVLAVAGTAMIRVFGWNYIKGWLATGWSTTQARVELGSVEEHRIRTLRTTSPGSTTPTPSTTSTTQDIQSAYSCGRVPPTVL